MKLSTYAKNNNLVYRTAYMHWRKGIIKGKQLSTGTIVIDDPVNSPSPSGTRAALYARTSSSEDRKICSDQLDRLKSYAGAKGYTIVKEIAEIGSGLNDTRPKLEKLLSGDGYDIIVVEHKDRLARFGINYIEVLLNKLGKRLDVINLAADGKEDLLQDLVSIVTSFCSRIYGLRRSKRKTEEIIKQLQNEDSKIN